MAETAAKGKKLVIVESPAKAKTIKKILGPDFEVKASVGHIRDLQKGWGKKSFGIDIENGYKPNYIIIKGKEKTVNELKKAASVASEVFLAPDPDREGEAIAWHLKEVMELTDEQAKRITYQAITKKAVLDAVSHPSSIDMDLVNAQQGRRVLDRLVGFSLSPFLWKKVAKNLSAGRVQSVAVRIVVDREREIAAFVPEEFWRITASLYPEKKKKDLFEAQLVEWKGEKFALGSPAAGTEESAREIADRLEKAEYSVESVSSKEAKSRLLPPFITSTLQQAASTSLRFGTSRTMSVAQKLYEGIDLEDGNPVGLITYMRTDSTRIAPEALEEVRQFIGKNYDAAYLPEKPNTYGKSQGAQDAHEAIRPTSVEYTPDRVKSFLSAEQYKLYELIWRRFVASQMNPARYLTTTVRIAADEGILEAKGRVTVFDGYTVLIPESDKKDDEEEKDKKNQNLPPLEGGNPLNLKELDTAQHFTKPPSRYSEASLVRALEKEGIGRPSTYAPIIKTIRDRGYVRLEKRAFHATELGMAVNDMLVNNFSDIMALKFTADMESDLDKVESGEVDWVKLIDSFYKPFSEAVTKATDEAEALKNRAWTGGDVCPQCGGPLVVRYSMNGAFLGCSNYPDCKGLLPMPGENDSDENGESQPEVSCPVCGKPMILKKSRYGKEFLACTSYPECKTTLSVDKDGKPVELPKIERTCEKCGNPMEVKMGRRGPFLACSNYPECKNTLPIDKEGKVVELPKVEGQVCDKCGGEMVVKMSRRGPFLSCSNYPKCRNAKPLPKENGESSGEGEKSKEE
ncbi:MAG: type I DNA topoisomerase [Spirochaetales bacterium]|nr:type I DNA topoisomerase [Spirochaetales bacterium]